MPSTTNSSFELRQTLEWITENTLFPLTETSHIEGIRAKSGHTVQVLASERELESYNCVKYALEVACGLTELPNVRTSLIQRLIDAAAMEERLKPSAGLLCVYFSQEKVKHIGWMIGESRVRSKWGTRQLYEHGILEVPISYGVSVRYYSPPSALDVRVHIAALADSDNV